MSLPFRRFHLMLAGLVLTSCNALSGADNLVLLDDDGDVPSSSAAGGTSGSGGFDTTSSDLVAADGVTISSIALYQGVRRGLMDGGQATTSTVPIVAGRDALLRVFYTLNGDYDGQPILARLTLGTAAPFEVEQVLAGSSTEQEPNSTINFMVPGEALVADAQYRVELLRPRAEASGSNAAAAYPVQGTAPLDALDGAAQLRIVLIPIRYDGDGSGRLPDISDAQQARYRDRFRQFYPAARVDLRVGSPSSWPGTVLADGTGWNGLLDSMVNFRVSEGASDDEYYYGIFSPSSTFTGYCGGACVSGFSNLAGPADAWARVGIGVGFSGPDSADTAVHEVGHQHGRGHAACGAFDGIDPAFPHPQGGIGSWGYDLLGNAMVDPAGHSDFMGYCTPTWVSDYTFTGLFERIRQVNSAAFALSAPGPGQRYERLELTPDGELRWLEPLLLRAAPSGRTRRVELRSAGQLGQSPASFHPYSHLPGGVLLFPARAERADAARLAEPDTADWIWR